VIDIVLLMNTKHEKIHIHQGVHRLPAFGVVEVVIMQIHVMLIGIRMVIK
tara:strand:+ start:99 stop:248 length:150 start_codon:yes stop_codon:yes gene_type:complete